MMPSVPEIKFELTWGNIASMITTVITMGTVVWWASTATAELRATDREHERRLIAIEKGLERSAADHDTLIEIRAQTGATRDELLKLRVTLEQLLRGQK